MKIVVDIDGVVCNNTWGDYEKAKPFQENIDKLNKLFDKGHRIIYLTARGSDTQRDWAEITREQFHKWGIKYHSIMFGKPSADIYIDDKAFNPEEKDIGEDIGGIK